MLIPRARRRLRRYATAFLLGAAILLVAGWSALPVLVERRLLEELRADGIASASLSVAAVGLHETRIEGVRLGATGDITAGEIIASYDFDHFLQARPQHLVVRDLRVSARLDARGLAFDSLDLVSGKSGGRFVDRAFLRSLPTVDVEAGQVELTTPIGPLALPFKGSATLRSDGAVNAAMDLQVQSAHGRLGGTLALVLTEDRIDANLSIANGTAAIGQSLSTAFAGRTKVVWMANGHPQVSGALDFKEIDAGGNVFPAGSFSIDMMDAQWAAQLTLAQGDGKSDLQTRLVVGDPYGKPHLSATGSLTAAAGAWLWPALGLPQPQQGSARFALRLDGPLPDRALLARPVGTPGEAIALLANGDVDGRADLTIGDMAFPGLARIGSATGGINIHASAGTIAIQPDSELRASGAVDPAFLQRLDLASALSALLSGRWSASVAAPQAYRLVAGNGETTGAGDFKINAASDSGILLDLQAKAGGVLSDDLAVRAFGVENIRAAITAGALPLAKAARLEIVGNIDGLPRRFDGFLDLRATIADLTVANLSAAGASMNFATALSGTDEQVALRLVDDGTIVVRGVAGGPFAGKLKDIAIPLLQAGEPLVSIDRNTATAAYDLRLGATKASAPLLLGGPKPLPIALALPGLRWTGTWSRAGGQDGTIELADGSLAFPSLDLTAKGVRAAIAIKRDDWSADLGVASIAQAGKPPLIVPLSLAGKAQASGDRLSFAGVISDGAQHLRSTVELEHSLAAGKGQATLKMPALAFKPGGLQPRDLLPAIGSQVDEVTGNAAVGGTIAWSAGKISSDLKLLLQDLSFKLPQADVARLNSVVTIDSLVPFTTRPAQQLAAGMVDVGLPLSDLVTAFHVEPGPRLVIEKARLSLAGGEVSMPAVAVDLADPRADLALNVSGVDLARLLQLAQIDGLAGTGSLAGRIPVSIAGDSVTIHDAALAASGPGSLRYAPATTPAALAGGGENVAMALQALSNFQYSDLTLTVSRESGGDTVALMQVKGHNPDFYGGYPVEFNLNISGKLDQILDRSLAGYRIPDDIRRSLGDFAQ